MAGVKTFWKLILTPASELKYDNYWRRANFGYAQLTDIELIHRLLDFDENLAHAYRYYQDLILAVGQRSRSRLNQLLTTKLTVLPQPFKGAADTKATQRKKFYIASNMGATPTVLSRGTNNKIKVIKRVAYGFRNFANFRIRILLALPNTYIAINWKNKQAARAKFRHELLNKTYSIFSSVLLDERPFLHQPRLVLNYYKDKNATAQGLARQFKR